ncbi:MAG: HyaD/HybD family hydrogenase maturation endopeptidase [Sulfurimonas sp.]|uniref:HyaD/HybD family hydrogenase maturation endopeptidase n=1 Tax=Sulfurimonas sp. TaxID=2022749 RepID=UPI00262DD3FA|nr:HyaD/HybD family hydrogenase maturation endopeptidase [Sulfurimonas sp.]MDD2653181.1 HyaD/HybD family hydrogenase maturation endopeptidase [Sulfurimonas sp.]MDD3450603.1 HyaD/HybD family hydrogenase maturation endopeptidase [Sulfurimonas sp.]
MKKIIVIGVGNLLFCDDGVGVIAAQYLRENFIFEPEIAVVDGGTLGFGLFEYFSTYDTVFVVDTISIDDEAGEIYKIPSHELLTLGGYKKSAHEVEVLQMLEICELYDKKADVTIIAVVPEDIATPKIGLSQTIKDVFDSLINIVISELEALGIKAIKKDNFDLSDIIELKKG